MVKLLNLIIGSTHSPHMALIFNDLLNPPYNTLPFTFPRIRVYLQQQNCRFCESSQSWSGAVEPYMVLPENMGARCGRAEGRMVCVWPTLPHSRKKVKATPNGFVRHELTVPD